MPNLGRDFGLDIDRLLQPRGIDVMMVGCGGAARQQKLGKREFCGHREHLRVESGPDRIKCPQPAEQFFAKGGYKRPRQGLVKMMVRIN